MLHAINYRACLPSEFSKRWKGIKFSLCVIQVLYYYNDFTVQINLFKYKRFKMEGVPTKILGRATSN